MLARKKKGKEMREKTASRQENTAAFLGRRARPRPWRNALLQLILFAVKTVPSVTQKGKISQNNLNKVITTGSSEVWARPRSINNRVMSPERQSFNIQD